MTHTLESLMRLSRRCEQRYLDSFTNEAPRKDDRRYAALEAERNGLEAALTEVLAELADAQKDAARMDWLDKYAHIATWVDNEPTKLVIDAASGDGFVGETWRECLDEAMKGTPT